MSYENSVILIDNDLVGIADRLGDRDTEYFGHPLIRADWGIKDHFRGAQGYYFAPAVGGLNTPRVEGSLNASKSYVNYGNPSDFSVLKPLGILGSEDWFATHRGTSTHGPSGWRFVAPERRFTDSSFTVYPDVAQWRAADPRGENGGGLSTYLEDFTTPVEGTTQVHVGEPNFYLYLAANPMSSLPHYINNYPDLFTSVRQADFMDLYNSSLLDGGATYGDHITQFRYPSLQKGILAKSNFNVSVRAYYNYYSEKYEPAVTAFGPGVEPMLPNLYMLESDLHNTSSVSYSRQLTLLGISSDSTPATQEKYNIPSIEPWFLERNQKSPEGGESYFKQYAKILNMVRSTPVLTTTLKNQFETKFRDVAILYPDFHIMKKYDIRDDRGTYDSLDDVKSTAFYPFYNEIIIARSSEDAVGIGGIAGVVPFLRELYESSLEPKAVMSFITALQLYALDQMESPQALSMMAGTTTQIIANGRVEERNNRQPAPLDGGVCNLGQFLARLSAGNLDGYEKVYNWPHGFVTLAFTTAARTPGAGAFRNLTFLREWDKGEDNIFSLNINAAKEVAASRVFKDMWENRTRTLDQVFNGEFSANETLMYIIEKRLISGPGPAAPGPVIQRIMISNTSDLNDGIRYIDTQVRYGARYRYQIKQVRMIFGNEYSYDSIKVNFGEGYSQEGLAVAQALGFTDEAKGRTSSDMVSWNPGFLHQIGSANPEVAAVEHNGYFLFSVPEKAAGPIPSPTTRIAAFQAGMHSGIDSDEVHTDQPELEGELTVETYAAVMRRYALNINQSQARPDGIYLKLRPGGRRDRRPGEPGGIVGGADAGKVVIPVQFAGETSDLREAAVAERTAAQVAAAIAAIDVTSAEQVVDAQLAGLLQPDHILNLDPVAMGQYAIQQILANVGGGILGITANPDERAEVLSVPAVTTAIELVVLHLDAAGQTNPNYTGGLSISSLSNMHGHHTWAIQLAADVALSEILSRASSWAAASGTSTTTVVQGPSYGSAQDFVPNTATRNPVLTQVLKDS